MMTKNSPKEFSFGWGSMLDVATLMPPDIWEILKIAAIIIIAIIADRLVTRYLRKIADVLNIRVETLKGLRFFFRFIILAFVLISLASVKWFPTEYFVGAGAIVATVIGFASATTISNFLSGAYVLISRVVKIGDYVKIGDTEGIVTDMSINYTTIMTEDGTKVMISNKDIMGKTIYNYRTKMNGKELFIYPISFSTGIDKSVKSIIEAINTIKNSLPNEVEIADVRVIEVTRLEIKYQILLRVADPYLIPKTKNIVLKELASRISSPS